MKVIGKVAKMLRLVLDYMSIGEDNDFHLCSDTHKNNFSLFLPKTSLMVGIVLQCTQPGVEEIFNHLKDLGYSQQLDASYHILSYQEPSHPIGQLKAKEAKNGKVVCAEFWENSLKILDELGEKANWKESPEKADQEGERIAIKRYQEFRRLIETKTGRPIPWVLEPPYVIEHGKLAPEDLVLKADTIRNQVRKVIDELNQLLGGVKKQNHAEYERVFITGLFRFVLKEEKEKSELELPPNGGKEREKEKSKSAVHLALEEFDRYLEVHGGLGLSEINREEDAEVENTALQTILTKEGWCTEQSKVLYAVLRMAGIKAFFVEPRLTAEYIKANGITQAGPPLPGHMAAGVGIKIKNENGKESIWILDLALGMLEADYVFPDTKNGDKPQWQAHPYWVLSLRHYWMADLANLGADRHGVGKLENAQEDYELALALGQDSTAYHAMRNYSVLLQNHPGRKGSSPCQTSQSCTKAALTINSHDTSIQYYMGVDFKKAGKYEQALRHLLKAIDLDPRYHDAFALIKDIFEEVRRSKDSHLRSQLSALRNQFDREVARVLKRHPFFRKEIQRGIEEVRQIKD